MNMTSSTGYQEPCSYGARLTAKRLMQKHLLEVTLCPNSEWMATPLPKNQKIKAMMNLYEGKVLKQGIIRWKLPVCLLILIVVIFVSSGCSGSEPAKNYLPDLNSEPCHLTLNKQHSFTIERGESTSCILPGYRGQYLNVTLNSLSDAIDLKLELKMYEGQAWQDHFDSLGYSLKTLALDDNGGIGLDPFLENFKFPEDAFYELIVSAWSSPASDTSNPPVTGEYSIYAGMTNSPLNTVNSAGFDWNLILLILAFIALLLISIGGGFYLRRDVLTGGNSLLDAFGRVETKQDEKFNEIEKLISTSTSDTSTSETKLVNIQQDMKQELIKAIDDVKNSVPDDTTHTMENYEELLNEIREISSNYESTTPQPSQYLVRIQELENDIQKYVHGANFDLFKNSAGQFVDILEESQRFTSTLSPDSQGQFIKYFEGTNQQLVRAISLIGIEEFGPKEGDRYTESGDLDLLGFKDTSNHQEAGTISEVSYPGYRTTLPDDDYKKEVIKKPRVWVYQLSSE